MKSQDAKKKAKAIPVVAGRSVSKRLRVFVGVSGGVDSSVALALLKEAKPNNFEKLFGRPTPKGFRGYDVTGVFLKVWTPEWLDCDWKEERRSAMRVCAKLGVPFITLDCEAEYKNEVVDYMIREYSAGRTPNPDVFCNKYVKFGVFLKKAIEMGADFVATGHYARVEIRDTSYESREKRVGLNSVVPRTSYLVLRESVDKNKDQSYFLYTLNQEQLSRILFPVGHLIKPEVRKLAEKFDLSTATKKDSQGLCFLGKVDMKEFLARYIKSTPGDVLNSDGEVIGHHDGAVFYTIGERHGFIITKKTPNEPRYFVVSKDLEKNTITVADKQNHAEEVYSTKEVVVKDLHFIGSRDACIVTSFKCFVRIRYRQEKQKCKVQRQDDGWHIVFENPQNGVAPGQSAVLYKDEVCLGGGIIETVNSL